jgi:transcriptional regulator with XRE-family HTH domain
MKAIHTKRYAHLRELLSRKRKECGFSQSHIAKTLGKPQSFISKVESGERRLDLIELLDLLAALKYEPRRFLRDT